jgi:hypothetical protein
MRGSPHRLSIVLQSNWVLVVMDQFTRRLVGIGVHGGPVGHGLDLAYACLGSTIGRGASGNAMARC